MNHTKQVAGLTLIQESCAVKAQEGATNNQRSMGMTDSKETKHLKTLHSIFLNIEWRRNLSVFTNTQRKVMLKEMAALEWAIEQLKGVMK